MNSSLTDRKPNIFNKSSLNSSRIIKKVLLQTDLKKKMHAEHFNNKNLNSNRPQTNLMLKREITYLKDIKKTVAGKTARELNDKVITQMIVLKKEVQPKVVSKITFELQKEHKDTNPLKSIKKRTK